MPCVVSPLCGGRHTTGAQHRAYFAALDRVAKPVAKPRPDRSQEVYAFEACDQCLEGKECGLCDPGQTQVLDRQ